MVGNHFQQMIPVSGEGVRGGCFPAFLGLGPGAVAVLLIAHPLNNSHAGLGRVLGGQ